jgi:hypothetical protein
MMRKSIISCLLIVMLTASYLTACSKSDSNMDSQTRGTKTDSSDVDGRGLDIVTGNPTNGTDIQTDGNDAGKTEHQGQDGNLDIKNNAASGNKQLLYSTNIDLDKDFIEERLEVYQVETFDANNQPTGDIEGVILIENNNVSKTVSFIKKPAGLSGVMSKIDFQDLDGDGVLDIFITIPGFGASFALNYYYIYNFKTENSYSYTSDTALYEFADSFTFEYMGNGKLKIRNKNYGVDAVFDISDSSAFEKNDDQYNYLYDKSWVEPSPVEVSEEVRIMLVTDQYGSTEIKVPIPVFGIATMDMIGVIDLYHKVDSDFTPGLTKFDIMDFEGDSKNLKLIRNVKIAD